MEFGWLYQKEEFASYKVWRLKRGIHSKRRNLGGYMRRGIWISYGLEAEMVGTRQGKEFGWLY